MNNTKVKMRNRFAKRSCFCGNSVLFITTIIAVTRVINTPLPPLLDTVINRSETNKTDSVKESSISKPDSNDSNISKTDTTPDAIKNDLVTTPSTLVEVSETNTVQDAQLGNNTQSKNGTESNIANTTIASNETLTTTPDPCKGLEKLDAGVSIDETSLWWTTMTSFDDVPPSMRTCAGSARWCESLAATINQQQFIKSVVQDIKLKCGNVCRGGQVREECQVLEKIEVSNGNESNSTASGEG